MQTIHRDYHNSLDVEKALTLSDRELEQMGLSFFQNGEQITTIHKIRAALVDALKKGYKYVPDRRCNHFDSTIGCLGHITHSMADKRESGLLEDG